MPPRCSRRANTVYCTRTVEPVENKDAPFTSASGAAMRVYSEFKKLADELNRAIGDK